ncbi:DUF2958 domain-containing protein [Sulfurimonas sp. SAG-AH-194-C21]|nr:DUF2958 domain-containing protein [Sulfurimonas sp. SAG-AH-194-C21]MDF1882607.1 DUF2958 domain-containing protein [Sulfurimonas sp. SAG-AH-194-C21]
MRKALIPQEIKDIIPKLYATEGMKDPLVYVKLFKPDSNWTWFILEFDPKTEECFGLVDGHEKELGYFQLCELEKVRGPLNLPIERDTSFKPTLLSKFK